MNRSRLFHAQNSSVQPVQRNHRPPRRGTSHNPHHELTNETRSSSFPAIFFHPSRDPNNYTHTTLKTFTTPPLSLSTCAPPAHSSISPLACFLPALLLFSTAEISFVYLPIQCHRQQVVRLIDGALLESPVSHTRAYAECTDITAARTRKNELWVKIGRVRKSTFHFQCTLLPRAPRRATTSARGHLSPSLFHPSRLCLLAAFSFSYVPVSLKRIAIVQTCNGFPIKRYST